VTPRTLALRVSTALVAAPLLACSDPRNADPDTSIASRDLRPSAPIAESRCYITAGSALGRRPNDPSAPGPAGPGWMRLDLPSPDSGPAFLVDPDRASLNAVWRRRGDSVVVSGFDDFLRVELRLVFGAGMASGRGVATSDATQERDSAGRLRDYRREWGVAAVTAPCDSMPRSVR